MISSLQKKHVSHVLQDGSAIVNGLLGKDIHVLREAVEVLLLLGELLPELEELFLLTLADSVVLGGALAALEGIAVKIVSLSDGPIGIIQCGNNCHAGHSRHGYTYPWPPVLGGAPVSPSAMARAVVEKVARRGRKAAVLVKVVRSMMGERGGYGWMEWIG